MKPEFSFELELSPCIYEKNKKSKKFKQLSNEERVEISILKNKGYTHLEIGNAINRVKSTVWNEINRNSVNGIYDAVKAKHKAYVSRQEAKYQCKKIVENQKLKLFIRA